MDKTFPEATAKLTGKGEVELNSTIFFDGPNPMDMKIKLGEIDMRDR